MKKFYLVIIMLITASLLWQCGGPEAKPVKELKTYEDDIRKFSFQYPADWHFIKTPNGAVVYTAKEEMKRFYKYDTEGAAAAKIEIIWDNTFDTTALEDIMKKYWKFDEKVYTPLEKVTFGGEPGLKTEYAFRLSDGTFKGVQYIAAKDTTTATVLVMEAFADTYDKYKEHFDKIIADISLAETPPERSADTIYQTEEAPPPSDTLKRVTGKGFSIEVPKNFNKERGMYIGQRRGDSFIRVDVMDASKQKNLDKIVKDSKERIPGTSAGRDVTIGGIKGKKIDYKPSGTVDGEMYWVIKGDKLFRITLNWFKGEASDYKPVFQKCVKTFKFE